jgi:hypothetical protein
VFARSILRTFAALSLVGSALLVAPAAAADPPTPPPDRDKTWGGISDAMLLSSFGLGIVMPRVYSANEETTEGWKARFHLSQLAPLMTISTLTLVNQVFLKDQVKGERPGCDDTNHGGLNCTDYGAPSSHAFAATSLFVHGTVVFLVDTFHWSKGRVNPASAVGNVAVPLVLGALTIAGRSAGNYESGGQIAAGATVGLAVGLLTGLTYAYWQRPDCGYSAGLICW